MSRTVQLIAYDITSNTARQRVAVLLGSWGHRVQNSVFIVAGPPKRLRKLWKDVRALTTGEHDKLLRVPLDAATEAHIRHHYGIRDKSGEAGWWAIV